MTAGSKHQAAAAKFAVWLNTAAESTALLVKEGGLYPASRAAQSGPALAQAPAFFANQPDFYKLAKEIADTAAGFTFGPNVNVTYSAYKDSFGLAITAKTPFGAAVDKMQTITVDDMKKNGFTVAG